MSAEIDQNPVMYFREYLLADGKAKKTVESYTGDVRDFLIWLRKDRPFPLARIQIVSYRSYLIQEGYQINTINKKLNSLFAFNLFLVEKKLMREQIVQMKKDRLKLAAGSEKPLAVFSDVEVDKILLHLAREKARNRLIVLLLLYTGLRVTELVQIKLKDIDPLTQVLIIHWGKGGKTREIPLKSEILDAYHDYLNGDRKKNPFVQSDYLLLTPRAGVMNRDAVNRILQKIGRNLAMKLHPHKFRHTFCTRLLKKGVDLTTIAKLAGHSSIHTTSSFYINTSREDKEKAVDLL